MATNASVLLEIRMKKGRDGPHTLVCTRPDGTHTMQHQRQDFFPYHDLTHFAVESVLAYRRGFWGLVADGWDLDDFGAPWPRGPLPRDIDPAELIVGALDLEGGTGVPSTAEQVNETVRQWYAEHQPDIPVPDAVGDAQLQRIREVVRGLHARWRDTPPGGTLVLQFGAEET